MRLVLSGEPVDRGPGWVKLADPNTAVVVFVDAAYVESVDES